MEINWNIYTSLGLQSFLRNSILACILFCLFVLQALILYLLFLFFSFLLSLVPLSHFAMALGILFLADILLLQASQNPKKKLLLFELFLRLSGLFFLFFLVFPYMIWQKFVFWRGDSKRLGVFILEYLHYQKEPQSTQEIVQAVWQAVLKERKISLKDKKQADQVLTELLPWISKALQNLKKLRLVQLLFPKEDTKTVFFALTPHAREMYFSKKKENA